MKAVVADDLAPFFEGWPTPPVPELRLATLQGADVVILAFDDDLLVGLATAITDGAMFGYVPLLEVLPAYRRRGIGRELIRRISAALPSLYGLDACCDDVVAPFYLRLGFHRVVGMVRRDPASLR